MADTMDRYTNRCERCKRKLSDPNAQYGWRCAEILGVTERLNRSGDGAFKAYMDGIGESNEYIARNEIDINRIDLPRFIESHAKQSLAARMKNRSLWKSANLDMLNALDARQNKDGRLLRAEAQSPSLEKYLELMDLADKESGRFTKTLDADDYVEKMSVTAPRLFAEQLDGTKKYQNQVKMINTNGQASSRKATEALFAVGFPIPALEIGAVDGSNNISSRASRFAVAMSSLNENAAREGSQTNAFRHALWSAAISRNFGDFIASLATSSHEERPFLLSGVSDYSTLKFTTLAEADEAVDLANNLIGRNIAESKFSNSKSMKDISLEVLKRYHTTGLWIAQDQFDGMYMVVLEVLSDEKYEKALADLDRLDENGRKKNM